MNSYQIVSKVDLKFFISDDNLDRSCIICLLKTDYAKIITGVKFDRPPPELRLNLIEIGVTSIKRSVSDGYRRSYTPMWTVIERNHLKTTFAQHPRKVLKP